MKQGHVLGIGRRISNEKKMWLIKCRWQFGNDAKPAFIQKMRESWREFATCYILIYIEISF